MVKCIPVHDVSNPVLANYLENYSRFFKHSRYLKQIIIKKISSEQIWLLLCKKKVSDYKSTHIRTKQLL